MQTIIQHILILDQLFCSLYNGEVHTFVYDGPIFSKPLTFTKGEVVLRENRFWYCDLVP
jgi:hypothetical protein